MSSVLNHGLDIKMADVRAAKVKPWCLERPLVAGLYV